MKQMSRFYILMDVFLIHRLKIRHANLYFDIISKGYSPKIRQIFYDYWFCCFGVRNKMLAFLRSKKNQKRRFLIHIGTEKTGTTTLQEFLHVNRKRLKQNGICYLNTGGRTNNRKIATYCMASDRVDDQVLELKIELEKNRLAWKKKLKDDLEGELNALSPKIDNIIISSEHFHSRLWTVEEISKLKELLKPFASDIKIIVYLRRQDKVAVSLFSTACRVGVVMKNVVPKNVAEKNIYYNYYNLLERWSAVFGKSNIILRVFEKEKLLGGDLVKDFSGHSGMIDSSWDLQMPKNQNEALPEIVQEVMTSFNKTFPLKINNNLCHDSRKLRPYIMRKFEKTFSGSPKMPCRKDAQEFYKIFAESNRKLALKWLDSPILFSEDFSYYPENDQRLKEVVEIFDAVFSGFKEFLIDNALFRKE